MGIFTRKKIIKVEIIGYTEGISDDDALMNYAVGHMMGGFDGMVHADILNESEGPTTTFKITYDNNTTDIKTVANSSFEYKNYLRFLR